MIKIENRCNKCPSSCINCGLKSVEVCVCDQCGEESDYQCEDGDYCRYCFEDMMDKYWNQLSLDEKADLIFGAEWRRIL